MLRGRLPSQLHEFAHDHDRRTWEQILMYRGAHLAAGRRSVSRATEKRGNLVRPDRRRSHRRSSDSRAPRSGNDRVRLLLHPLALTRQSGQHVIAASTGNAPGRPHALAASMALAMICCASPMDAREVVVPEKALRVELVDVIGPGRTRRERAPFGHDLQPANRGRPRCLAPRSARPWSAHRQAPAPRSARESRLSTSFCSALAGASMRRYAERPRRSARWS
jgi:hypothetical protein